MGDLSTHFSKSEFRCECGCGKTYDVPNELISKLESLYSLLDKCYGISKIIVTSGFRCVTYGVKNGFCTADKPDAHCKNLAVDIHVYDNKNQTVNPVIVAMAAEIVGFNGIGIMKNACHVDIRNNSNYYNSHWFGNETNGKSYNTFRDLSVFDFTTLKNSYEKIDNTVIARFELNGKRYGIVRLD